MKFYKKRLKPVFIIALSLFFWLINGEIRAANKINSERFKCPLCNIDFSVFTDSESGDKMAIDGQPLPFRPAPLPQCPLCGGVFSHQDYSKKETSQLKRIIWSKEYQKLISASSLWKDAFIKERMFYSDYELFIAWHKAALQETNGSQKHRVALGKAVLFLTNWLTLQKDDKSIETAQNHLKLADILRQASKFDRAQQKLNKLIKLDVNELKPVIRKEQELIKSKTIMRVVAPNGNRLHRAITENNKELVKSLLENKSFLNESDLQGNTPLILAIKLKRPQMVSLLLKNGASPVKTDANLNTPLHIATQNNHLAMVKTLLKATPGIDHKNISGQTALHIAARNCYLEIFNFLLKENADTSLTDSAGNSVLHLACTGTETARINICKNILELQPRKLVNLRNYSDYTPLHIAAINGAKKLVPLLVKAGADIDARLPDGSTALFFCRPKLIPHLISLKADKLLKNNRGLTAFEYALLNGLKKRIHFFRNYMKKSKISQPNNPEIFKSLQKAIKAGKTELARRLVNQSPNLVDYKEAKLGETALHIAAANNQTAILNFLLKNNAKLNSRNFFRRTPLHYAAMQGNLNLAKTLIDAGADLFAVDLRGNTPLHDAATSGDLETYKYLIKAGAADSAKNNSGLSPDDIFTENKEEN
jgi:ankyrin repeat protein